MKAAVNIHATCVRLARAGSIFRAPPSAGVLLLGESGSGKSDLALRLIARGAQLVADDRTELFVERGCLLARAPRRIAGLIEIRGLGIVEMPHAARARIVLAVDLSGKVKRLPDRRYYAPPKPLILARKAWPARMTLSAFDVSAPEKILAAVAALHTRSLRDTVKGN